MQFDYKKFTPYKYMEWLIGARNFVMSYNLNDSEQYKKDAITTFSNYEYFVKNLSDEEREIFAKNVRYFQMFAAHDEHFTFQLDSLKVTGYSQVESIITEKKPVIYCTYHVGSYRLISHYLIKNKIPFSVVVDQNYINSQGEKSMNTLEKLQIEFFSKKYFEPEFINAEQRTTGLEVIRRLKSGRSVLFYIDGNTGVNQFAHDPSKMIQIDFFKRKINARKGIAYLSYKSKTPIVPVYMVRHDWLKNEMVFPGCIVPDAGISAEEYCSKTTNHLFKILENILTDIPEQWEGWMYVNNFLLDKSAAEKDVDLPKKIKFNADDFYLQELGEQSYLFNKKELKADEITKDLLTALRHLTSQSHMYDADLQLEHILIKKEVFPELLNRNIIQFA